LLKGYIYAIGIFSSIMIPIFLIIDCFKPILGRGPHAKKKVDGKEVPEDKSGEKKKKQEPPIKKKLE